MDVWHYMPQQNVTESLEWQTYVQRCRSAEYRHSLRTKPRQEFQVRHVMTPAQFSQARLLARNLGASSFFVPVWPMHFRPGDLASSATVIPEITSDSPLLFDVGTSILVWENADKWEVAVIQLNSSNPAYPYLTLEEGLSQAYTNPVVVPLRVGEFAQEFQVTRNTFKVVEAEARFRILIGDDYSNEYVSRGGLYASESYLSHPVVTDRSIALSGVQEQFERRFDELDSVIGGTYRYPTLSAAEQASQITWSAQSRTALWSMLYWLHSRKGRWKSFWVSSWNNDFTITHEIASSDTSIEIADIGVRTWGVFPFDIVILTDAGARIYKRVTGAIAGTSGHEVLGLSSAVGSNLYTWNIESTSVLTRMRFDSDRIEVQHGAAGLVMATAQVVEVPA